MPGAKLLVGLAVGDVSCPPVAVFGSGGHEVVGDAYRMVRVLEKDGAVGIAVDRGIVAPLDEDVGFALFLHFAFDEFDDIRMIDVEDYHFRGSAGFAAALDDACERIEALHEAFRAGGDTAA